MTDILKRALSGLIILVPVTLLAVRFVINFCVTAVTQLAYKVLGQEARIYWDMENEWVQFQMDMDTWYDIWKTGGGDH